MEIICEKQTDKIDIFKYIEYPMSLQIFSSRSYPTRTVDLLGKTDQTDYYQNDLNCFKDPTCIFLHWALSLTDISIS